MELLLGLVFLVIACIYLWCQLFTKVFMWVCDPMIQHAEAKEKQRQKFMSKVEVYIDRQEKKEEEALAEGSALKEDINDVGGLEWYWPLRSLDSDMN